MDLGAFSLSLPVKDLAASKAFYERLGFEATGGSADDNYWILKNGTTLIGIFHGMFEEPILTFNPGLAQDTSQVDNFTDLREIEQVLKDAGASFDTNTETSEGPASFVVRDPDGNILMWDQFF